MNDRKPTYYPMPSQRRFWGLHSEQCYTDEELSFRESVLKLRTNSGIHRDFLQHSNSWFADASDALMNPYERSWLLSFAYKPRHMPNRDDFFVQPIDGIRLQWAPLESLMKHVGDYLILRNQNLRDEHLNQPMNFVLMDINHILRQLSQNPDAHQVKEQLEYVTKYLRAIEKTLSPTVGSDKLFLANFRHFIDNDVQPRLTLRIESKLLQNRLDESSKTLRTLAKARDTILHFVLNDNEVNAHAHEISSNLILDYKKFPTLASQKCLSHLNQVSTHLVSAPKLTSKDLKNCPNFKLITDDDQVLEHYARAISDLNEMERYQTIITQVIDLLGQAGEVYTISQFKEQMLALLKQLDQFIDESSLPIEYLIHENTQAYHKAIQDGQNVSYLRRLVSSDDQALKKFIKNQDTLAQFPSSASDLKKAKNDAKMHVNEVVRHLTQAKIKETNFETLSIKAKELNQIMGSMSHIIKSIEPPQKLKPIEEVPVCPGARTLLFFNHPIEAPKSQTLPNSSEQTVSNAYSLTLFSIATPLLLSFVILSHWYFSDKTPTPTNDADAFEKLRLEASDLITMIQGLDDFKDLELFYEHETYQDAIDEYEKLVRKAARGHYRHEKMQEILEDLQFVFKSLNKPLELS